MAACLARDVQHAQVPRRDGPPVSRLVVASLEEID